MNENTKYVSHFLRVPYKDYPDRFREAVAKHRRPVEVNEMRSAFIILYVYSETCL